jgi:peptidoglycan/LPS O-acetylase OafA/YrhL
MPVRRLILPLAVCVAALLFPAVALAAGKAGNDVGANLGKLMQHYAAELYGGIVAFFSLGYLVNRQYKGLAVFLLAAVVVAWMVFSPDQIASTARSLGRQILS